MIIKYLPSELVIFSKDDQYTANDTAQDTAKDTAQPAEPATSGKLEPLKDQNLIDVKAGLENSGDEAGFLSMLGIFLSYADENVEELNRFYSEEDFENYTIKIHALKSSSRIIGALGLANDAQVLENAGKAKDFDIIRNGHDAYVKKFLEVTKLLEQVLEKSKSQETEVEASSWLLNEAYYQIKKYAETGDYDAIDNIYREMADYTIPLEAISFWDQVKEACQARDSAKIKSLLG